MSDDAGEPANQTRGPVASKLNAFLTSEPFWLQSAFVIGLAVIFLATIAALEAVFNLTGEDLTNRVDVIYKLTLLGVVAVTFCTVVWRGLITTRQADAQLRSTQLQREQIDKLALQIAATEENNLADLLQQGAELIAEAEKKAHVAAGIAILQSVVEAPNAKFSSQAMNLLADYVQDSYGFGTSSNLTEAAVFALNVGAKLNRHSTRHLVFRSEVDVSATDNEWIVITGVARVLYSGGKFNFAGKKSFASNTRYTFVGVLFDTGVIDLRPGRFRTCVFEHCHISGGSVLSVRRNEFRSCDFSDAEFDASLGFPDLRSNKNYFDEDSPPSGAIVEDWGAVLNVYVPPPQPAGEDERFAD